MRAYRSTKFCICFLSYTASGSFQYAVCVQILFEAAGALYYCMLVCLASLFVCCATYSNIWFLWASVVWYTCVVVVITVFLRSSQSLAGQN